MRRMMIAVSLMLLTVAGCASTKSTRTSAAPVGTQVENPTAPGSQSTPTPPIIASPTEPAASSVTDSGPQSPNAIDHQAAATNPRPAKAKPSTDNHPPKPNVAALAAHPPAAPSTPAAPTSTPAAPTPTTAALPGPPTLNLSDLEQRLRDTRAIGVFTKLSLKNQVDDLLTEFRSLYQGPNKHPTATLRQHYDLLLLKVLSLLQDSDPPLAAAISSSREAIWGILADPSSMWRRSRPVIRIAKGDRSRWRKGRWRW